MGRGPQSERRNLNKGGAQGKVWRSRVWITRHWAPKRRSEGLLGLGGEFQKQQHLYTFPASPGLRAEPPEVAAQQSHLHNGYLPGSWSS